MESMFLTQNLLAKGLPSRSAIGCTLHTSSDKSIHGWTRHVVT